ncbi:MAG: peptidoglycan-binding protein [Alkaliphilus sp.]|nr:peptidoglycan-binding protein [Alkaliphilus sp.]
MNKILRAISITVLAVGISSSFVSAEEFIFSKNAYKVGMNHSDIKVLQEALRKDGSFTHGVTTTYFGTITERAVMDFQKRNGLLADGIVGKRTLNKMKELGILLTDVELNSTAVAAPISRGTVSRSAAQGLYLDWFTELSKKIINRQDILVIEDVDTGKSFKVKVTAGTNHADCEALSIEDTEIMKDIWGGFSWDRRAVLVHKDDSVIAASMTNMPHAGVESKPGGETVSNRSGGFGRGYNFDFIKNNGMDGHVDLHFKNSRTHGSNRIDDQHQNAVKLAAGLK